MENKPLSRLLATSGNSNKKKIAWAFEFSNSYDNITINTIGKSSKAVQGFVIDNNRPIPGIRVSAIKDYVVDYAIDKLPNVYNGIKTILDWDITDKDGKYILFLEPGTYTIRIDYGQQSMYNINTDFIEGICEYYSTLEGTIKRKFDDTISFYDTDLKLITGVILDEYNKYVNDAEIIISQNDNVIVYQKTHENGKFAFALSNGIYDVRLRAKNQSVIMTKNFDFNDTTGFFTNLKMR